MSAETFGTPVNRLTRSIVGGAPNTKPAAEAARITKIAFDIGECQLRQNEGAFTAKAIARTTAGM